MNLLAIPLPSSYYIYRFLTNIININRISSNRAENPTIIIDNILWWIRHLGFPNNY